MKYEFYCLGSFVIVTHTTTTVTDTADHDPFSTFDLLLVVCWRGQPLFLWCRWVSCSRWLPNSFLSALFGNVTFVNETTCMFFFGRITVVNVESRKKIVLPSTSSPNGKAACQMDESTLNLTYTLAEEIQNLDLRLVLIPVFYSHFM